MTDMSDWGMYSYVTVIIMQVFQAGLSLTNIIKVSSRTRKPECNSWQEGSERMCLIDMLPYSYVCKYADVIIIHVST